MKEGTPNIASIFYNNSVQNINDFSPTYKKNCIYSKNSVGKWYPKTSDKLKSSGDATVSKDLRQTNLRETVFKDLRQTNHREVVSKDLRQTNRREAVSKDLR